MKTAIKIHFVFSMLIVMRFVACGSNEGKRLSEENDSETDTQPARDTEGYKKITDLGDRTLLYTDDLPSILRGQSTDDTSSKSTDDTSARSTDDTDDNCEHPDVVEDCEDGWCRIEPGCFLYGSYPTEPCRSRYSEEQVYVTLTHPYVIAQTEVTQAQWESMGLPNPSLPPACPECPITMISWFDILVYFGVENRVLWARSEIEGFADFVKMINMSSAGSC